MKRREGPDGRQLARSQTARFGCLTNYGQLSMSGVASSPIFQRGTRASGGCSRRRSARS